jgi:hypothetical protein
MSGRFLFQSVIVVMLFSAGACRAGAQDAAPAQAHNTLTEAERAAGWKLLFDGKTVDGWRNYMAEGIRDGWQAVDGEMHRVGRGGDIITTEQFQDFELTLEWKLGEGGNSGVFYRAVEGPDLIYYGAPEMQILDDERHRDGQSQLTSAGANYGINPAPRGVVKPVGEWNTAKIVVQGNHVEHWLNGQKIVEYEFHSDDWKRRVQESKFRQWPEYGQAPKGHIGIQDHGSWVAFRNVKVRVIGS